MYTLTPAYTKGYKGLPMLTSWQGHPTVDCGDTDARDMVPAQTKSKERVAQHGEVLTGEREVNAMLDLVKQETERIESRFLEPACGTGNFLAEILRRKLVVVDLKSQGSQLRWECNAVLAVSSLYGIEILEDNVQACRQRLFELFDEHYTKKYKRKSKDECRRSVHFLLKRNIIWGDALTLKTVDQEEPIVFSQWSPVRRVFLKRRDFEFQELLPDAHANGGRRIRVEREIPVADTQYSLFEKPKALLQSDTGESVYLPRPVREFPPKHFLELSSAYED